MSTTTNLNTLKINVLTEAQYEAEIEAGTVDENALYLTPESKPLITDVEVDGVSVVSDSVASIDLCLKGTTATLTPSDIADALANGQNVELSHTDATFGQVKAYSFNYGESVDEIVANLIFRYGYDWIVYELHGNTYDDTWAVVTTTVVTSETDPIFTASTAYGITSNDVSNWNGKSDFSGSYNDLTNKPTLFSGDYNDLSNKPTIPTVPTNVSAFTNDAGYLTSFTETDPTVPSWAKQQSKPSYSASEISGLIDMFYPVGSYYETSDTSFDPNVTWGGTWSLETAGQVHISAGTGYAVSGALSNTSDGGNKDAVVPYHTHTLSRTTDVGVAAHGITQPAFTIPNHTHTWKGWNGLKSASSGTTKEVKSRSAISTDPADTATTSSGGGGACTRTTNVSLTNNHSVTQPVFSASYAGTSGNTTNANMQPYIIVNRWHRTA